MKTHSVACPVCGTASEQQVDKRKTSHGVHRSVLCPSCGMVWANPRPSESVYLNFYRSEYTQKAYGLDGTPESIAEVIRWRTRRSKEKIGYFPKFWKRGQSVLEIGAGLGAFIEILRKQYGCKVQGIEPSPQFVDIATRSLKLNVFKGTFDQWFKKQKTHPKFDRIVMDQILEHMLEPAEFLKQLHGLLKPGGQIFISVPSMARPKEDRTKFFIFEHVSSFSPFALSLLLLRAGFKPTGIFEEKPGSLQMTAAPMGSDIPMLDPKEWGKPVTAKQIRESFAGL